MEHYLNILVISL